MEHFANHLENHCLRTFSCERYERISASSREADKVVMETRV